MIANEFAQVYGELPDGEDDAPNMEGVDNYGAFYGGSYLDIVLRDDLGYADEDGYTIVEHNSHCVRLYLDDGEGGALVATRWINGGIEDR